MTSEARVMPRRIDYVRVAAFAIFNLVLLAAVIAVRQSPSPFAPRVNVRWIEALSDDNRIKIEDEFQLLDGQRRKGTTWSYDLGNPSVSTVKALIAHPAVADTHHIDRGNGTIAADAPRGSTRLVRSGLSAWRGSTSIEWASWLAPSSLLVAGAWLISHRQALKEPE